MKVIFVVDEGLILVYWSHFYSMLLFFKIRLVLAFPCVGLGLFWLFFRLISIFELKVHDLSHLFVKKDSSFEIFVVENLIEIDDHIAIKEGDAHEREKLEGSQTLHHNIKVREEDFEGKD
jgi:hypothetical protein